MAGESFQQALALLAQQLGRPVDGDALDRLQGHLALIRQWNDLAGLVSAGDAAFLEEKHVIDSLSLAPYVLQACGPSGRLLDIGSGGGFPAIPLKCLLPELDVTLVDRSSRKASFLHRVAATLGLENVRIVQGNFPEALPKIEAHAITARAVERPRPLTSAILKRMPTGCSFLCQTEGLAMPSSKLFHVERIEDAWRQAALRRGELYVITHQKGR